MVRPRMTETPETPMNADLIPNAIVEVGGCAFGNRLPLSLIAGPCALESRAHALEMAAALKEIAARLKIGLVYKTSFDKANRTSAKSARGIGLDQALPIFADIRDTLGIPVLTDVHEIEQCARVAEAVDVLQIPAFLCRQTDLLIAAGENRQDRQRQEGPVPGALGHEERGGEDHRRRQPQRAGDRARRLVRLQHARLRHARAADPRPRHRRAGDLRRHPFGAAAGRAGHLLGRRARIRAGAGARRGRGRRRRRVHRDASGSGQGAVRRTEHGAAQGDGRLAAAADGIRSARRRSSR